MVRVHNREYHSDAPYATPVLASENAAMRAYLICRNFSVNDGRYPSGHQQHHSRGGVMQGMPVAIGTERRYGGVGDGYGDADEGYGDGYGEGEGYGEGGDGGSSSGRSGSGSGTRSGGSSPGRGYGGLGGGVRMGGGGGGGNGGGVGAFEERGLRRGGRSRR